MFFETSHIEFWKSFMNRLEVHADNFLLHVFRCKLIVSIIIYVNILNKYLASIRYCWIYVSSLVVNFLC